MIISGGWHGTRALAVTLKARKRETLWQSYTGTVLWMIGKVLARDSWTVPSYVELAYPGEIKVDTRSADQIKADILQRLTE